MENFLISKYKIRRQSRLEETSHVKFHQHYMFVTHVAAVLFLQLVITYSFPSSCKHSQQRYFEKEFKLSNHPSRQSVIPLDTITDNLEVAN